MICHQYDVEAVESVRSLNENPDPNLLCPRPIKYCGSCRAGGRRAVGRRRIVKTNLTSNSGVRSMDECWCEDAS